MSFYCENTIIQYTEMPRRKNIHFRPMFINCKIGLSWRKEQSDKTSTKSEETPCFKYTSTSLQYVLLW